MSVVIEGREGVWEYAIGLEVHAQVASASKLFLGAPAAFGAEPNTQVSLVDAAMPGMLPVINRVCVEQAVRTGLGLGGRIARFSVFDRKNYFYRTCRRATRSRNIRPCRGGRIGGDSRPHGGGLPACTWSRMRARACMTATPTAR